jgi:LPS-assembly protein
MGPGARLARAAAAVLAAALAAGVGVPAAAATIANPGSKVLLRADKISYDTKTSVVMAEGNVEVDYEDRILLARRLTYNQNTDTVTAEGHISLLLPDGNVVFADKVGLTQGIRDGVLDGFRALIGETGRLAARRAVRRNGKVTYATRAAYTPCKICNKPGQRTPTWEVKARRIVYDEKDHRIYYHDAVLELFGVPVFYTPIFSHADPTVKHKTGLLRPVIGSSSAIGSYIELPVYIALSDSRDMTVAPMISTEGGEVLQTEYRERWSHGGMWLQASGAYNPHGGLSGNKREWYSSLFGSGRIPITNTWTAGYDIQLTSNDTYLKRYDLSSEDNLVSDLFVEAISGRSRFAVTGYFFQDLRAGHISNAEIPLVLPLVEYTYIPRHNLLGGQFRFDFSSATVTRNMGQDSERVSAEMRWRLPFVTDGGQLLSFTLDARGDVYRVSNADPAATDLLGRPLALGTHYVSRGQPYLAIDWRWPFIASGRVRNTALVIEPIVQLIAAPYGGNPSGIPNEDSTDFELDETDIFSDNRIPGHALWESGPRANIGLRTEAFFPSGSVEILLGQVFRLKSDRTFPVGSGLSGTRSDIVGRYTLKFPPYISLTHRVDIDASSGGIRRNEVYFNGTYGRSNIEVGYVRLAQQAVTLGGPRQEVNGQIAVGLLDHWVAFAAARRDLEAHELIDTEFGLGWEDDCLGLSLSYQRRYTRDRDVPPSTSIIFAFKVKTGDETLTVSDLFPRRVFSTP